VSLALGVKKMLLNAVKKAIFYPRQNGGGAAAAQKWSKISRGNCHMVILSPGRQGQPEFESADKNQDGVG
jgi:hypothetical protein